MSKKLHVNLYFCSRFSIGCRDSILDLGTFDNEEDAKEEIMRTVEDLRLRNMLYSWHTVIEYVENKEENTMTNAEMAKKIKEFEDRLDRCDENQSELNDGLQQLETKLKNLRPIINSIYGVRAEAKTKESMYPYPCLWSCEHKGKECNRLAQECPIAEHFSKQLQNACDYCKNDVAITLEYFKRFEDVKKDIIFSEFNAGKRAVVFSNSDHLEKDYLDFWREFDEWCSTSEKNDKLYPQSSRVTRSYRMDPFMKCSSIYEDHSSFAIWIEHNDEEGEHVFEYGTLQSTWREHNTVGGLPYTEWSV